MTSNTMIETLDRTEWAEGATPPRRRRRASTRRATRRDSGSVVAYVILSLATVIILGPFLLTLATTFRTNSDYIASTSIWPQAWTLQNYIDVFTQMPMLRMLYNGLFIAILATAGNLFASLMAAFAIAKLRFPGRGAIFGVIVFTLFIPGAVTMIPLYTILRSVGLVDTPWALILPMWTGTAFAVFFLRQFVLGVPNELYEAAVLDGCTPVRVLFTVYLPLVRGPLAVLAILGFLGSWNDLLGPLIYLNSPDQMTAAVGLTFFQGQYATNFPALLAGAVVILVPTTVMFLIFNRQIRDGMITSGMK